LYFIPLVQVEEDDVEKANPPSFDRVEDLAQLRYSTLEISGSAQGLHTRTSPTKLSGLRDGDIWKKILPSSFFGIAI
jgi:hypothetical protein